MTEAKSSISFFERVKQPVDQSLSLLHTKCSTLRQRWAGLGSEGRIFYTNLGLTTGFAIADLMTTYAFQQLGYREQNPLGSWVFDRWGFSGLIALKVGLVTPGLIMLNKVARATEHNKLSQLNFLLRAGNIFLTGVCINNLSLVI